MAIRGILQNIRHRTLRHIALNPARNAGPTLASLTDASLAFSIRSESFHLRDCNKYLTGLYLLSTYTR